MCFEHVLDSIMNTPWPGSFKAHKRDAVQFVYSIQAASKDRGCVLEAHFTR
jgi:hypothetical protein